MSLRNLIRRDIEANGVRSVIDEIIIILDENIKDIEEDGIETDFSMVEIEGFSSYVEAKYKHDILVPVAEALDVGIPFDLENKLEKLIRQLKKIQEYRF